MNPTLTPGFEALTALLADAGLCYDDLTPAHLDHFVLLHDGKALIGAVGLEVDGVDALLRSLVVAPDRRGEGLGLRLVDAIEAHARETGVTTLYLLTTTAADFFAARGYTVIDRTAVPEAIAQTHEFRSFCPDSATCMRKQLG